MLEKLYYIIETIIVYGFTVLFILSVPFIAVNFIALFTPPLNQAVGIFIVVASLLVICLAFACAVIKKHNN
jgi:hypothetical protein